MAATPLIVTGREAGWHRRRTGHRGIKITLSGCGLFARFGYLFEISGGFLETFRPYFRSACEAIRYQLLDFYPTGARDGLTDSPTLKPCEHIAACKGKMRRSSSKPGVLPNSGRASGGKVAFISEYQLAASSPISPCPSKIKSTL